MIPSVGLRWSGQAIGIGRRRIELLSSRQFSSSIVQHAPIRRNPLLCQNGPSVARLSSKSQFSRTNVLIRNGAGVRFASGVPLSSAASTTPPTTPADAASSSAGVPSDFASSSLDEVTDWSAESLANVPHYIGYLKHLGLDYWTISPTNGMEWLLEHVHVLAGTPWWASIALTVAIVRIALFKFYVNAAENSTRMATAAPITKPLLAKMNEARVTSNTTTMMEVQAEIRRINKRAGVSTYKSFIPFIGGFATYGMFKLLRAMSAIPALGLETGGTLWFPNLAIPDPYFLLPMLTAGVLHALMRLGGETGQSSLSPNMQKVVLWAFPAMGILFSWWMPAAVQITFFTQGLLSFIQVTCMRQTWFRRFFNMTPIPKRAEGPDGSSPSPYKGNLRRAASPVLSQAELSSRFQSTSSSFPRPPGQPKSGILGSVLKPIEDAMKPTIKAAQEALDKRQKTGTIKSNRKEAENYEKKRQKEIEREHLQRAAMLREERARRKNQEH
ncbi:Mitochondrial inner membrane protein OXA1 [Lachnellula suecica]|uniref:Mitochondrial inner membrane protein OXA1 n=1 Tax=Lachnellula suecica TaxID=602035 RepID=A0A8T9C6X3_9HELO|nr:Mitochondrial inner membrane protein OXA1 [Lachnellula suecica]